jgi:hypothetical protein
MAHTAELDDLVALAENIAKNPEGLDRAGPSFSRVFAQQRMRLSFPFMVITKITTYND